VQKVRNPRKVLPVVYENDFEADGILEDAVLFWGVPGPRTGVAVALAKTPTELVAWLRDRAVVEGPKSALARALPALRAAPFAQPDADAACDAIAGVLEEGGIPTFALGPLARELVENDAFRTRVWTDTPAEDRVPERVWSGGEAHVEAEGSPISLPEKDSEPEKGYKLDEEMEEWAEHEERLRFDREEFREFLAERLEALRTARPQRRAA
jgi:hypothetical protein